MLKEYHNHSVYFTYSPPYLAYVSPTAVSELPMSEYLRWAATPLKQPK